MALNLSEIRACFLAGYGDNATEQEFQEYIAELWNLGLVSDLTRDNATLR